MEKCVSILMRILKLVHEMFCRDHCSTCWMFFFITINTRELLLPLRYLHNIRHSGNCLGV